MTGIINKIDIPEYNSLKNYMRYDIVYYFNNNYFISKTNNNLGNLPFLSGSNSNWYKIGDAALDFSTLWTPSYTSAINTQPRNLRFNLSKGGVAVKNKDGINTIIQKFELIFEKRSTKEIKALLGFLEFMGKKYCFYYTLPEPYNKKIKFFCEEYSFSFDNFEHNSVKCVFSQDFTPFLESVDSGAGQSHLV